MNSNVESPESEEPKEVALEELKIRFARLDARRDQTETDLKVTRQEIKEHQRFIQIADQVTGALEILSEKLFQNLLKVIEAKLTIAIQEVLEQPIELKSVVDWKRNSIAVDFLVERNGNSEDILKGQGGSVANILSIGLRMFALTSLDEKQHRRVLILDEQDCWLHPDLVPRLVRIVHEAGSALGFQVLMISHHDVASFVRHADRVYRLTPDRGDGVGLEQVENESDRYADEE